MYSHHPLRTFHFLSITFLHLTTPVNLTESLIEQSGILLISLPTSHSSSKGKTSVSTTIMHSSASDASLPSPAEEKRDTIGSNVAAIHTNERVPGNTHYYEKNGLRTYGDDEDHDHEPPVCAALSNPGGGGSADGDLFR